MKILLPLLFCGSLLAIPSVFANDNNTTETNSIKEISHAEWNQILDKKTEKCKGRLDYRCYIDAGEEMHKKYRIKR